MDVFKKKIFLLLENHYEMKRGIKFSSLDDQTELLKFLYDRRNAALGDSLINFIYSCTKSLATKKLTGLKIPDTILLKGFSSSKLALWLKLHGSKKDKANAIEALILFLWLVYDFEIEEMVSNLMLKLNKSNFSSRTEEERYASYAFSSLFDSFDLVIRGS